MKFFFLSTPLYYMHGYEFLHQNCEIHGLWIRGSGPRVVPIWLSFIVNFKMKILYNILCTFKVKWDKHNALLLCTLCRPSSLIVKFTTHGERVGVFYLGELEWLWSFSEHLFIFRSFESIWQPIVTCHVLSIYNFTF